MRPAQTGSDIHPLQSQSAPPDLHTGWFRLVWILMIISNVDELSLSLSAIDRYINHSCAPNCITEVVTVEKENKIIISSCRRIQRGEEVPLKSSQSVSLVLFPEAALQSCSRSVVLQQDLRPAGTAAVLVLQSRTKTVSGLGYLFKMVSV